MKVLGKKEIAEAMAQGKALVIRKYKACDEWTNWKPVAGEVALRKVSIFVDNGLDEDDYDYRCECPYQVALA